MKITMTKEEMLQVAISSFENYNKLLANHIRRDAQNSLMSVGNNMLDCITAIYEVYYSVATDDFGMVKELRNCDNTNDVVKVKTFVPVPLF